MYKTITVKIGSNVLSKADSQLDIERIENISNQIASLHQNNIKVILVSSGAVAAGRGVIDTPLPKDMVSCRQLLSSVGQVRLLETYSKCFKKHDIVCAQVLASKQDFRSREHYLNMKNCLSVLLDNNIIPIINENDAVSVTALMFTDNDELGGLIAGMINSDCYLMLTNVDGVYSGNPSSSDSYLITEVQQSNNEIMPAKFSNQKSEFGRGGIITKNRIAQKTAASGIDVYIANGYRDNIILDIINRKKGVLCTKYVAGKPDSAIKKWMAYSAGFTENQVHVNSGAANALISPGATSLLLAGVTGFEGGFKKGDLLRIIDDKGELIGIGKAQYDRKVAQRHLNDVKYKPLIHYDYLLIFSWKE